MPVIVGNATYARRRAYFRRRYGNTAYRHSWRRVYTYMYPGRRGYAIRGRRRFMGYAGARYLRSGRRRYS